MYNAFCLKCKKRFVAEKQKDKCPYCGGKVKILGRNISLHLKGPNTNVF